MQRIIALMLVILFYSTGNSQILAPDKQKHFAAGFAIGGMSAIDNTAKHPFLNAILFSSVVGISKEIMDIETGTPEVKDAVATIAGGIIGGAITYTVKLKIDKIKNKRKRKKLKL